MPQTVRLADTIARPRHFWQPLVLLLLMSLAGCNKPAEIRSYQVPKTDQEVARRLVVATLLADSRAWFFKIEGSPEAIAAKEEEVTKFFESIVAPESPDADPTWEVPEGWEKRPASQMRLATLVVPSEGEQLEMAISQLQQTANEKQYLLMNVNRWRGQLGLEPIELAAVDEELKSVEIEGGTLRVFDATGTAAAGGSRPPMMTGPPRQSTPSPAAPEAKPAAEQITYDLPEGWSEAGSRSMVLKVLRIKDAAGEAEVAISVYDIHGAMADPLSNVNRWRGQVGLEPTTAEQLSEMVEKRSVAGAEAMLVSLVNPDGKEEGPAMIAAMVPRGDKVWFLKLSGPRKVVDSQREAFDKWLKTVRMAEGNS
jgi:hypothetical protein